MQLINTPGLARARILQYNQQTKSLHIKLDKDKEIVSAFDLSTPQGRKHFELAALDRMKQSWLGELSVASTADKLLLHLVNEESVRDLARRAFLPEIDKMRFQANIYIRDLCPWEENAWVGKRVRVGPEVELMVTEPTIRCPATWVNPTNSEQDIDPPSLLRDLYPEASTVLDGKKMALGGKESRGGFMGLYARVVRGGRLSVDDPVVVTQD
jgi:uncharacterized protein YcbX